MAGPSPSGRPGAGAGPLPSSASPGSSWSPDPPAAGPPPSAPSWPAWMAPVALVGGLVLAALAGLAIDLPALALGVHLTTSHTPPGLAIANTFVQDLAF